MNAEKIEKEIVEKGLTAPRVTPEKIESIILSEHYFTASEGATNTNAVNVNLDGSSQEKALPNYALSCLTFCVLVLKNGFTVTGESACASPANFNAELGRKIARNNAVQKIWTLEGYALREKLSGM